MSLGNQIQQFEAVRGNISQIVGHNKTDTLLSKSLFIISIGSNDLFELVDYYPNATDLFKAKRMERLQLKFQNHLKVCVSCFISLHFILVNSVGEEIMYICHKISDFIQAGSSEIWYYECCSNWMLSPCSCSTKCRP